MKISITGQENGDLLIQVIAGAGLTVDQIYRLTVVLKVETAIITSITASPILVIMYIKTFKSDINVFISNIIMCLTSH